MSEHSEHSFFSEDDQVCFGCVADQVLGRRIKKEGERETCVVCRKQRRCVSISRVGEWLKDALPFAIEAGRYGYCYDRFTDTEHFQGGHPLGHWIGELLGIEDKRLIAALVGEVTDVTLADYMDGDTESPWNEEHSYVAATPSTYQLRERWEDFEESINHRFRFFNEEARSFLSTLLANLPEYRSREVPAWPPQSSLSQIAATTPVVRSLEPGEGWSIYRARLANNDADVEKFESDGARELGPPPSRLARAGRMNPEGVSVFYGSGDRETCVSEMRPHMDSLVATAEFRLTRPVVVLDFRVLEDFFRDKPRSIFDPTYAAENELRTFLQTLHRLIRAPIRPGEEHLYLRTQVLAEYLVTQHEPPIQGVVFSSAQHEAGANLVLFPNRESVQSKEVALLSAAEIPDFDDFPTPPAPTPKPAPLTLERFPLAFVENSLKLHRVGAIRYEIFQMPSLQDQREHDGDPDF